MSDIRAALHAAIDDMTAVGWADALTTDLRWEDVHAVIDATLDAADSLDAAWAEAEAALPEGFELAVHKVRVDEVERRGGPYFAVGFMFIVPGPTPAAALRALAERLRD